MNKITHINLILRDFFELNFSIKKVYAKDMMPYFVLAGIFKKDEKNGLPIRNILRQLDEKNQLNFIPFVVADRKAVYTKWYFENKNLSTAKIMSIQKKMDKAKNKKSESIKKITSKENLTSFKGRLFQ